MVRDEFAKVKLIARRNGGNILEPLASFRERTRLASFHAMSIPIHSPLR